MKALLPLLFLTLLPAVLAPAAQTLAERTQNTVVLDETGVKNLRIETVEVEETTFEETVFSLGHLEVLPGNRAIVSSRIPGRAYSVLVVPHTEVDADAEVAWVESRQPGDPPPVVKLTAPIAGMVSKVNIAPGQPVSPDAELIEILDLSTLEAVANVPQHLAGRLKMGQAAHIKVHALPGKVFEARLVHMAAMADEASGTMEAAFHLANPDKLLRPGMRAEFNIVVGARENVTSVPRGAIQGSVQDRFVYVKDFDLKNAFVKVPVVIGTMNDRFAEITHGLLPGDEVVTHGAYSLSFAGASSVSLKDALDAAHGHEHAEDGSELTTEKRAEKGTGKPAAAHDADATHQHGKAAAHDEEHDHDHDHEGEGDEGAEQAEAAASARFWRYASAALFALLLLSLLTRKGSSAAPDAEAEEQETKPAPPPPATPASPAPPTATTPARKEDA